MSGKEYRDNLIKSFLEIFPPSTDDFLKLKETLTRIGIANYKTKTLYQSAHILHKQNKYYITHFKELFALDGKCNSIDQEDLVRRDNIAVTLQEWGMLKIILPKIYNGQLGKFTIIKYEDKLEWELKQKYLIGGSKVRKIE